MTRASREPTPSSTVVPCSSRIADKPENTSTDSLPYDRQCPVVLDCFDLPFVIEAEIIDPVGQVAAVEGLRARRDDAVAREGVVVVRLINLLAPAVVDEQVVVAILVGILRVDIRVQVLDGEHVVEAVAVGRDDIGEHQVLLNHHRVGDLAVAACGSLNAQCHVVVAPLRVGVRGRETAVSVAVIKIPSDGSSRRHQRVGVVDEVHHTAVL